MGKGAYALSPSSFRIIGVDRSSGVDVDVKLDALTEANARVKAELRGIIVTSVEAAALDGATASPRTEAALSDPEPLSPPEGDPSGHVSPFKMSPVPFDPRAYARASRTGIGGWLILPAIGIVISPLMVLAGIAQNMTLSESPEVLESFRTTLIGQTLLLFALFGVQIAVAVSFFMKKRFLPKLMVGYMLGNIALTVVVVAWTASIIGIYPDAVADIMGAVIVAAVWIPYFLISERVKNTFVM